MTAVDEKNHFKKKIKKIAPANYTAEVVCIDQILLKEYMTESGIDFLIIFSLPDFNET